MEYSLFNFVSLINYILKLLCKRNKTHLKVFIIYVQFLSNTNAIIKYVKIFKIRVLNDIFKHLVTIHFLVYTIDICIDIFHNYMYSKGLDCCYLLNARGNIYKIIFLLLLQLCYNIFNVP